jgi:hypothetical protein
MSMPPSDAGTQDSTVMDVPTTDMVVPDAPRGDGRPDDAPPADAGLPDLTVDQPTLRQDVQFAVQYFGANSCELGMDEQCITAPGWRRLLMFTTLTPNVGTADLNLGNASMTNPNFMYSTCHEHYHFLGYADYSLLSGDGGTAAEGHKQSFCVEDLVQVSMDPGVRTMGLYDNCGEGATGLQGISAGWADEYYPNLPCQWIDVTDIAPGDYTLQVSLNYMHRFAEADYSNNIVSVPVTIPSSWATTHGGADDPTRSCRANTDPDQGIGRDCGWTIEGVHTCTPGEPISVGCNSACGAGRCSGDWQVRICRGSTTCKGGDLANVIQQDYGLCGSNPYRLTGDNCPDARFRCPVGGQYTVMVEPTYEGSGRWTPGMDTVHPDPNLGYCIIQTIGDGTMPADAGADAGDDAGDAGSGSDGDDAMESDANDGGSSTLDAADGG